MKTAITELLKIEYPILQGGMAWVSTFTLAAAVSEAGGLGIIAAGGADGEYVRDQIQKIRERTKKPFGVNVMLMSPYAPEVMKVVLEEGVPVVTTGAGNPGKYLKDLKANGTKVLPVIPTVALARKMEREGADGVIAEGTESGGHIGELTTMALIPQVVDAVNIPVIGAGGIGDGRGMLAAFSLGAQGVQIGTRFICSTECHVHQNYKQAVIEAGDRDAIVSGRYFGTPVRSLKNGLTREFQKLEEQKATREEFELFGLGALRKAVIDGDTKGGSLMAGQISGLVKDVKCCREIIEELMEEYAVQLSRLRG